VIPQVPGLSEPIAAWGDAITVLPTVLHDSFADDRFLVENLDAMIAWVDAVRRRTSDAPLWEDGRQFGDWLDPDTPPDQPGKAATDPDIVATAYFQRSARLASEAAMRLGQPDIAERYSNLADRIREAFLQAYVTPSGRMMSDSPTAYALAIVFDLVDAQRRAALGDRLAELLRRRAYRIATGFVGTPIVCDALTRTGHGDVATRLLLQTENPSWLYPVTMGATTVWERWDSLLEDGSLNPGQMTSFNHFALGAVVDWMHRALGGLTAKAPGYRRARFAPLFADGIDDIAVWHDSPYGRVDASWHRTGAAVRVTLDVPEGIEIDVDLPGTQVSVGAGHHRWDVRNDAPPPAPGVPSLDGPMTDVLDSPEAYAAVFDELVRWDPDRAARLRRSIVWTAGRRLRDPLDKVPVEVMERISARLRG
jgi:alpha-L-rhamnosidase